jgi:DNA-binding GntR family transcriptional regulator
VRGELPRVSSRAVAAALLAAIERGEILPGARLPSILKLSEAYGTTTGTAARALQLLADAGRVVHVAGKGWFAPG